MIKPIPNGNNQIPNPKPIPPSPPVLASGTSPNSPDNNQPYNQSQISPLTEANPESLDELFSRIDAKLVLGMPKEISEDDISRVVDYYRKLREQFVQDQANFIKPGRKTSSPKAGSAKSVTEALKNAQIEF